MRFLVLAALRAILALAEEYSFWEDDAQVQVEASRPNSFLACSTTTLEELREAVMRPGAEDVIDAREGIADKLRQAWKTWRVSRATRSFVLPTQPVHVECVLELECLQAQGCDEVLFLLPFHEAMQVNGIVVTDDERKDSLGVLQISGQSVVDVKCSHNFPDDGDPPTPLELNEDYCRTACHPGVYGIRIADGVPHGESTRIRVSYNLGKAFSPQQSTLPRGQQQRVIFATTTLIPSPYHVALQLTRFAALDELNIRLMWLNTYGNLEEDAENEYVCGPFEKVELLSYGEHLAFSLDFHDSLEFIPWLHTRVHVPLWPLSDHMDIFEEYVVHNDASPFQGHFSELTHAEEESNASGQGKGAHYVTYMEALFPTEATKLRYYDSIGNISRAHHSSESVLPNHRVIDLLPRFPLFGGWTTSFVVQYRLPQCIEAHRKRGEGATHVAAGVYQAQRGNVFTRNVKRLAAWVRRYAMGGETVVCIPFYPAIYYMYIHERAVTIRLPPGATVRRVEVPGYATFRVRHSYRRMLGASIRVQEVEVRAERLSLHTMQPYVADHVRLAYTLSATWLCGVMGTVAVHAVAGYTLLQAWKRYKGR